MLLERLRLHTRLTDGQIERYAATASMRYRVYEIDKRNGRDKRRIEQPSREIKALQRWLVDALIRQFPVHDLATAYSRGANIRRNAEAHRHTRFTLRLDFEDFFPSFKAGHVDAFVKQASEGMGMALNAADLSFIRRIVCRNDALTIGAPSSPLLTNAMMYSFDAAMAAWCAARNLVYTRYADDLFISAHEANALTEVAAQVAAITRTFPFADLKINAAKTAHLSRRYRRSVTGLIITPDGKVSLGRERKRQLKSDIHRFKQERAAPEERSRIAGMIAFAQDVERPFYETLVRKYGEETLKRIARGPYVRAAQSDA